MKLRLLCCLTFFFHQMNAQNLSGKWYGTAQLKNNINNYLIELVVVHKENKVTGYLNYYFKNEYRCISVAGIFSTNNRKLSLKAIAMPYAASTVAFNIDCDMQLSAVLVASRVNATLKGIFSPPPNFKYTCGTLQVQLKKYNEGSNYDSVLLAISLAKEAHQWWQPEIDKIENTNPPIISKKKLDLFDSSKFEKRNDNITKIIYVERDTINLAFYDNGEIDGDEISVFLNQQLLLHKQVLSHKAIRMRVALEKNKDNEITMYAENLGLIPPNTALMIVEDGSNKLSIGLSADLQTNATVIIKHK